eukprot:6274705-Prymnesium_polylepis.1
MMLKKISTNSSTRKMPPIAEDARSRKSCGLKRVCTSSSAPAVQMAAPAKTTALPASFGRVSVSRSICLLYTSDAADDM